MAVIQDSVNFIDGKASMKNGVKSTLIENISDEEVSRGPMENASMIISRKMRPKILYTKVEEEVAIPGVIRGDEEVVFVGEILIDRGSFVV
jgi:hypothetical protein